MIGLLFVLFFILLALGVPIAFVLVISTVLYGFSVGDISLSLIHISEPTRP